ARGRAPVHPLRRLRQRLPTVRRGRRPHLRVRLRRRDRARDDTLPPRPRKRRRCAEPLPAVQRVRDRLPGRDPAAASDPRRAPPRGRRGRAGAASEGDAGGLAAAAPVRQAGPRWRRARGGVRDRAPDPWPAAHAAAAAGAIRLAHAAGAGAAAGARHTPHPRAVARRAAGARGLTVAYFVQCLTDRLFPDMAQATVDVIAACGARVVVPPEQHCCGLVCDDAGDRAGAVALAKQTIEALDRTAAHWIVTGASSCAIAMLHDYEHIFAGEPAWQERARRLAGRTLDFTSFLSRVAQLPDGALANGDDYAVTYHNFCGS